MTPYTPDSIRTVLTRLPLFSELSDAEITMLLPGVREYTMRAHEMLFHKGERLDGIHIVVSGQIRLFMPGQQGTEKLIYTMNPGASFAEGVIFLDTPCPVSAQATQDGTLLVASRGVLLEVLDCDPKFARKMLTSLSTKLHQLMMDMETCTLMNSVQRVVCFLSHQVPPQNPSRYEVTLDTSKQLLASRLNLAPETFSRALHHLVAAGLIEVHGRTIHVMDTLRLKNFNV